MIKKERSYARQCFDKNAWGVLISSACVKGVKIEGFYFFHHVGLELKVIHHHHYCFFKYNKLLIRENVKSKTSRISLSISKTNIQILVMWCIFVVVLSVFRHFLECLASKLHASCAATDHLNRSCASDRRQVIQLAFFWHRYFYAWLYRLMAAVQKWCLSMSRVVVHTLLQVCEHNHRRASSLMNVSICGNNRKRRNF